MKRIISFLMLVTLCGCATKVESITMDTDIPKLGAEDELELVYSVEPEDASLSTIKWNSSDENVAVVKDNKLQ